ncbi:pyridoxal phosphate-dependent decarboxylase family protein [Phaeodactylibacter luteus]|uniref:Aminotransferase class V-fold PLP-dependent enzyme n=1 Tax=Phaeodactylibacter luteus TaxID=1564516 RepID=A0A5C6RWS8_9BACT|nr:pyridoxal-dependent decarboxylase [Phaeodactylibacter luteus]TXB66534.1 aminotransferase class V-fold PLP-dependent enzyme [Phaeodactylibacter luteus]
MDSILEKAYDAEAFRNTAHRIVDQLADFLKENQSGEAPKAIAYRPAQEAYAYWESVAGQPQPTEDLFGAILAQSVHLHHPQYMGHQVSPPAPLAALGSLLDGLLNNGMAVYEMGMASTAIERVVTEKVAQQMGFGPEAGGVLTSGGTLANLTALLTARSVKAREAVWSEGQAQPLALMVSEEAHYCVDRAVRIMGWGEAGIIKVPVNEKYQMRADLLPGLLADAEARGQQVIAVVGSACSTSTGSFDDLNAIAAFCEANGLWFHVDGAHGAALAFSPRHRHVLSGLSRADSVAMDFHKMLLTPVLATALIYKEGRQAYRTFSQRAHYLWAGQTEEEWENLAKRTFECTKYMIGVKVLTLWQAYGMGLWEAYLDKVMANGETLGRLVEAAPDFELALRPQCNIVCFRYAPDRLPPEQRSARNARIREALLADGAYYIVQTILKEELYLRVTLTSPHTEETHLRGLLDKIREVV